MNKVYVNLILSYDKFEQDFLELTFNVDALETDQIFIDYLFSQNVLSEDYKDSLRKISICIFDTLDNIPKWILSCNGKIYLENRNIV